MNDQSQLNKFCEKISNDIERVYLMTWEQVLLLAIYARNQYNSENRSHFYSRMKFVEAIRFVRLEHKQYFLNLLEEGGGITAIAQKIDECIKVQPNKFCSLATDGRSILAKIDDEQIAFSAQKVPFKYSYYSLYKILFDPIPIFQSLLKFKPPELMVEDAVIEALIEIRSPPSFSNPPVFFENLNPNITDVDEIIEDIKRSGRELDVNALINQLQELIENKMACWMNEAFASLYLQQPNQEKNARKQPKTSMDVVCEKLVSGGSIELKINKQELSEICYLGGSGELMRHIQNLLLSDIDKSYKESVPSSFEPYLSLLRQWHNHTKTNIVKGKDQILKVVAALIDFDIQNKHLGFFWEIQKRYNKVISKSQSTDLTARVIHHCFYKNRTLDEVMNGLEVYHFNRDDINNTFPQVSDDIEIALNEEFFNSTEIKVWANYDEKKTKERLKQGRKLLNKHLNSIEKYIDGQKSRAIEKKYPINSEFPRPLWKCFD